ncbi:hypothetical protein BsWGS_17956 [Bradybaena similaris]
MDAHGPGVDSNHTQSYELQDKAGVPVPDKPVIDSRQRSSSTWTNRSTVITSERPIYRTRSIRDKYVKVQEKNTPLKETLRNKVKDTLRCNRERWKSCALSVFPFIRIMRKYQWKSDLPGDIISGLTVGIMQLPQGMAYAMLADLPPVVGLYVSFFPVIIYFLFGTSKQISMGTVAVVSLMTGGVVAGQATLWRKEHGLEELAASGNMSLELSEQEIAYKISIAATVAFVTGLIQIGLGLLQVGFVTTYMGDSLVSGFTTGAALHVFTSQVKYVFGISIPRFPNLFQIINTYIAIIGKITETNVATLILSLICMVVLYLVKTQINDRFKSKLKMPVPVELLVVVVSTLACHYGEFKKRWHIKVVGEIPAGLPPPQFPAFANLSDYGVDCIIIAVVAFAQSVSLAVLMAKKHHYDIDSNKELIGYGMGTLVGSFFSCYPIAASVSRSSVQDSTGGKSQISSLVSAALVLIVILFIGPLFENLPNCALSAIIMVALKSMFMQILELKTLYKVSKFDCAIWIVTFLCVVILHVDMGLVAGIVFACFTVVMRSQVVKVRTLEKLTEVDEYRPTTLYSKTEPSARIRIVSYNSPLYYANSELFLKHVHRETSVKPEKMRKVLKRLMTLNDPMHDNKKKLDDSKIVEIETVTPQPLPDSCQAANGDSSKPGADRLVLPRMSIVGPLPNLDPRPFLYLIIDCAPFTFVDTVGIKMLKQLIEDYKTVGITTYLGGVRDNVWSTMENAGFTDKYERVIFWSVRDAVLAAEEDRRKKCHPLPDGGGKPKK